jgi:hypothetical protein
MSWWRMNDRYRKPGEMCKLDLEKSYDHVN